MPHHIHDHLQAADRATAAAARCATCSHWKPFMNSATVGHCHYRPGIQLPYYHPTEPQITFPSNGQGCQTYRQETGDRKQDPAKN